MIINVRVKPKSFREGIVMVNDNSLIVSVKERVEDNKANVAVIKALTGYFKVPSSQVNIKAGFKSRKKVIEIAK